MLIRFGVENFKSFNNKQELIMIPSKHEQQHKEHIITIENVKILKNATIYGANASGKSNFIEAITFANFVITNKIPKEAKKMFCRVSSKNRDRDTYFEFEFFKDGKFYAYGFSINLFQQNIKSEWLYELFPQTNSQKMYFERELDQNRIEIGGGTNFSEEDMSHFMTYKHDFGNNASSLFLTEMNRNKRLDTNSSFSFFQEVYNWFKEDLSIILPDQPVNFEYFFGDEGIDKVTEIISLFDTGISKVKVEEISIADFKNSVPSEVADQILTDFYNGVLEKPDKRKLMSVRGRNVFYNLETTQSDEPKITTIMLEHMNSSELFDFSEESDGTRRLFDLLDILLSNKENKIFIIDEMDRSLHPKLTYKFLELFFNILQDNHVQLIFTTHESTIMDQKLLRRDEIWFVERDNDNNSHIYSLDRFNERYDKILNKAYLDGRYGAIPVFSDKELNVL